MAPDPNRSGTSASSSATAKIDSITKNKAEIEDMVC
jgi:hypothetical protein